MVDHIPILWNKCCNLRKLGVIICDNVVSRQCDDFLFAILKLQRTVKRKIECLTFGGGALLSAVFPLLIELCSDTLTQLQLSWWLSSDSNVYHPAVELIGHAVRLCRNLQWFESDASPDGIGKILIELSDKVNMEMIDIQECKYGYYDEHSRDLVAEIPELAECLATLQSADRPTEDFELSLNTIRELSALIDAGDSKNIEWNMITKLGMRRYMICICEADDPGKEWIKSSKQKFDRIFQRLSALKSCAFEIADVANRDCSGLVESFLGNYQNATEKRHLRVDLCSKKMSKAVRELGRLLAQVKKSMGISGSLSLDTSYLEESGPLDPAEFDILSKQSVKFQLGSAQCTIVCNKEEE